MAEYALHIPAPREWINANRRDHWAARAELVRTWRSAAYYAAVQARLPKGLAKVRIDAVLRFRTNRHRDAPNYHPTLKAVVDGLATSKRPGSPGYGLIPDDTEQYLVGPFPTIGERIPRKTPFAPAGLLTLTITDLSGEAS